MLASKAEKKVDKADTEAESIEEKVHFAESLAQDMVKRLEDRITLADQRMQQLTQDERVRLEISLKRTRILEEQLRQTEMMLQEIENNRECYEEILQNVQEQEREAIQAEMEAEANVAELQALLDNSHQVKHEECRESHINVQPAKEMACLVRDDHPDECIGIGGHAQVNVAQLQVAASILHPQPFLHHSIHQRLSTLARVCHPNLQIFIGAHIQREEVVIITELIPTSLRTLINRHQLSFDHILSISIDVACALNYLHHMSPEPIIHRDLSSANVLLQPTPNGGWLAKVSDYGTSNFQSQLQTENPGNPVYTAPEFRDPVLQSPKMDIYSFGVLLVEMCTCEFPSPDRRAELIESIEHPQLVDLITQCLQED